MTEPGWYHAQGDPAGTTRYWDGQHWIGDAVPTPPGTGAPTAPLAPGEKQRPWWGPVDGFLAIPVVLLVSTIASIPIIAAVGTDGLEDAAWTIVVLGLIQQAAQFGWPAWVSRRKGLGMKSDWGLFLKGIGDIGRGVLLGLGLILAAGITNVILSALIELDDPDSASNTAILTDNTGSIWLVGIIFVVVVGAPVTEELMFRGLMLRSFLKYGEAAAVALSTFLFVILHYQFGQPVSGNIILLGSLTVVGLILALSAIHYSRIGIAIVAHMVFNGFGTVVSLFA